MRRGLRVGLAAAATLTVLLVGGYAAFWFVAAHQLEDRIGRLQASLRRQKVELAWQSLRIVGFPLTLRLDLRGAELRDRRPVALGMLWAPQLSATAAPWDLAVWRLAVPGGLWADAGGVSSPLAKATARTAAGTLTIAAGGSLDGRLVFRRPTIDAGASLTAETAEVRLALPARSAKGDEDVALVVAVDARDVTVPLLPAPLRNPLDQLAVAITLRGPVPAIPPPQAAAAWRDAGGTVDFDHLTLRSGALTITGSGTVALDGDLQPEGAFSLAVEDYPRLLTALVAAGRLRQRSAGLARLALSLLAKPGPDGKPEINAPLTIQNGRVLLGPVALGRVPHLKW